MEDTYMLQTRLMRLVILSLASASFTLLASCSMGDNASSDNGINPADPSYADSFNPLLGAWTVYNKDNKVIGGLILEKEGQYKFQSNVDDGALIGLKMRLPFIYNLQGSFYLSFKPGYEDKDKWFSDLSVKIATIATCRFGVDKENFEIRLDQKRKILFFHGGYSELQLWGVEKEIK